MNIIVKVIFVIFHVLCIPVHLVTFLLLFLYKWVIILLAKLTRDFVSPIPGSCCVFFADNLWSSPHSSIVLALELEGKADPDKIVSQFQYIYDLKDEFGQRCYRELGYTPVRYCGHAFWKECPNFKIASRVHILKNSNNPEEPIASIGENMLRQPYQHDDPVWDVFLVYHSSNGSAKTTMFLRCHHLLADGMSLVKFFYCIFGIKKLPAMFTQASTSMSKWNDISNSIITKIVTFFTLLTVGFVEYLDQMLITQDKNLLNFDPNGKLKLTGNWICTKGKVLDVTQLKIASKTMKCSIMHILFAGLSKALQKYFVKYHGERPVPKEVHFVFPIPIPGHPDLRLVNHWTIARVAANLSITDTTETIREMQEEMKRAIMSSFPLITSVMFRHVTGFLPYVLIDLMTKVKVTSTVVMSNMVGPQMDGTFGDCKVNELFFWMPIVQESMPLSMAAISYNGKMQINLTGDLGCIPDRSRLDDLGLLLYEEIVEICRNAGSYQ